VSFSFTDSINDYESGYANRATHAASFQTLNETQRAAARRWIGTGGEFYNVSLLSPFELTGASDRDATIRMAESNDPGTAYAYYPNGSSVEGGDVWFNPRDYNSPTIGNYAYLTFGHEFGHALGLKHPHETGGVRNVAMNSDRDSMEFSIMSYRSYVGASTTGGYTNEYGGYAQSLMMYDIAAIQHMYGAWFGYNSTNTTYTFSTTTGEMFVNGVGQGTPAANRIFRTIWDGNGIDTYDFSNYTTNQSIDLTPGGWSDLDASGNFQNANLGNGNYARGHVFNALQYNGDVRSLIENANGGSGNDTIVGNSANNVLNGNGGNDTLNGGDGNDTLNGGDGNDTISGGGGDDYMNGGAGIDTVNYTHWSGGGTYNLATGVASFPGFYDEEILNFENILTGGGNDTVIGSSANNTLNAGAGNDNINGGDGIDTIYGGAGNDTVDGGNGNDLIYLGDGDDYVNIISGGNDTFYGGNGNDFIYGYTGNETYYGEAGNDTLWGSSGNDTINGGAGADSLDGGANTDTLSYVGSTAGVSVNLATNTVSGGDAIGDTIVNFENVTGSSFNDTLTGSSGNNILDGGVGNDTINGGDGIDTIYGGAGNDTVDGGNGDDRIYLGDGDDYLNITSLGNDTFYGGNGNDFIYGYTGNETYYGEAGNDTLLGYSGNDILIGGAGKDTLTGGSGIDKFTYTALSDSLLANYDVITDYTSGEQIDAPSSIFAATLTTFIGTAASLSAAAISGVLTSGVFGGNSARAFTVTGQSGTFIALNDAVSGFNSTTDSIIFLQNFTIGAASPVSIV
jgi:serralysin